MGFILFFGILVFTNACVPNLRLYMVQYILLRMAGQGQGFGKSAAALLLQPPVIPAGVRGSPPMAGTHW